MWPHVPCPGSGPSVSRVQGASPLLPSYPAPLAASLSWEQHVKGSVYRVWLHLSGDGRPGQGKEPASGDSFGDLESVFTPKFVNTGRGSPSHTTDDYDLETFRIVSDVGNGHDRMTANKQQQQTNHMNLCLRIRRPRPEKGARAGLPRDSAVLTAVAGDGAPLTFALSPCLTAPVMSPITPQQ